LNRKATPCLFAMASIAMLTIAMPTVQEVSESPRKSDKVANICRTSSSVSTASTRVPMSRTMSELSEFDDQVDANTPAEETPAFEVDAELLQDLLDERHVCDEGVEMMIKADEAERRQIPVDHADQVPAPTLIAARSFLWQMTQRMRAPTARFFESARLFEVRCRGLGPPTSGGAHSPERIIGVAAAAWLLCYKFSEVQSDPFSLLFSGPLRNLAAYATKVSVSMGGQEVTEEALRGEERKMVAENCQNLGSANVLTWLEVFVARLDVASAGLLSGRLQEAMAWAEKMATTCVCYGPSPLKDSPLTWARGILVMALAHGGLIPMESIAPPGAPAEEGAATASAACAAGSRQPYSVGMVTAALEFAVCSTMEDIRAASWKVMEVERHWQPSVAQLHQCAATC